MDRATFPSDAVSTHALHPRGVAALGRWGLLERLRSTGCPAISTYAFDFGHARISGSPATEQASVAYAPRRTVLDELLVTAAAEAGAQVREGFTVTGLVFEDGAVTGIEGRRGNGPRITEGARIVVGADGTRSSVARLVQARKYRETPKLAVAYYSYWRGLPVDGRVWSCMRPGQSLTTVPTHDDLTLIVGSWPFGERLARRSDVEGTFASAFDQFPDLAEQMREAERVERFTGAAVPNFFRAPSGPGWVLAGDAGYTRDPVTAQGMSDAFASAELCAEAVDDTLRGARPAGEAMRAYQEARDAQVSPMYEFTCNLAGLEPLPPKVADLFASLQGDQEGMDRFARLYGGALPPAEFFARYEAAPAPAPDPGTPPQAAGLRA